MMKYKLIGVHPFSGTEVSVTLGFNNFPINFIVGGQETLGSITASTTIKYTIKDQGLDEELVYYCAPFNSNVFNGIDSRKHSTSSYFHFWIGNSEDFCYCCSR